MTAAILIAAGVFLLYHAFGIEPPRGFSVVDPNVFPIFVSVVILGLGIVLLLRTTLVPDWDLANHSAAEGAVTHWTTVWLVGGTLVVYAFALAPVGYIVSTAAFVPACARWLGSTHWLRDTLIGVAVAIAIFAFFTGVLGIRLPEGILAPLL